MPSPLVGEGESEGVFGHGVRGRFPNLKIVSAENVTRLYHIDLNEAG